MFKIVKKAVGMKPAEPGFDMHPATPPPPAPASLPSSPSQAPSKQLSKGDSLSVPPKAEDTLDLASPISPTQHTNNRISLISPFDDNHAVVASPVEQHAGFEAQTSEWPIYDSPESFNTLDERLLKELRQREEENAAREREGLPPLGPVMSAAAAVLSPVVEESSSTGSSPHVASSPLQRMTPRSGNGSLRPEAHAVLKGSPKVLGWQVDEDSEIKAWEFIMKDAVESSVYDRQADEEESETTHLIPHSREELYRTWLKHWDEVNTSLVWKVVPSLKGIHQWIPEILGEGSVLSTGVEMGTDTDDLPCLIHADAEVQTTSKTYADVEVQTYEAELPPGALMLLPEKPLKAPTQDFDLAQTVAPSQPEPVEKAESIASTRSRSRSPFRRMLPSRKNSTASINSLVDAEPKPKRSQSPATDTLKRLTSMRALSRKGAPSRKGTVDNASSVSVNIVADGATRTQTSPPPVPTPALETRAQSTPVTTPAAEEPKTTPTRPPLPGSQPGSGKWGSAMRRANFALGWR